MEEIDSELWDKGAGGMPAATIWCCHRNARGTMARAVSSVVTMWLAEHPKLVRLRMVIGVGGEETGVLWFGLTVPGVTEQQAQHRVREEWAALLEVLELYGLQAEPFSTPPDLRDPQWLGPVPGSVLEVVPFLHGGPHTLPLLKRMGRRKKQMLFCVELQSPAHDQELVEAVRRGLDQANQLIQVHGTLGSPSLVRLERLYVRLLTMSEVATQLQLRLSLHGNIPGTALLPALLRSLGRDLGMRLERQEQPRTIHRGPQGLVGLMQLLQTKPHESTDEEPHVEGALGRHGALEGIILSG